LSNSFRPDCGIDQAGIPDRVLATALTAGEGSLGFLCLGRDAAGKIFTAADQKLLTAIASLTAAQIENVRLRQSEVEKARLESELELAREVQRALAPSDFACCDYLDADGASVPCQQIAGDYFDLLPLGDDQCLLVVADVSGKGPAAALQAAMLQGIVHAAIRHTVELPALMVTIHECLRRRAVMGAYATVFLGILERFGRLRYSNGGHNAPLWIRSGSRVTQLTEGGPLLGMLEGAAYREGVVQLEAGDLLLLYTDGVTEAQNPEGESWGLTRLLDWARRQPGRPAAEVHQGLLRSVTQFCRGGAQGDDLTTLVVRYRG
jgi:sigma-B regulation protein RsbU (phosphoserine phosphatase)